MKTKNVFKLGVKQHIQNGILILEVDKTYLRFLSFIFLRELYNCFIPDELRDYETVQIVINQIIMIDLYKHKLINEWRSLIRENIKQYDFLSLGFNRLSEFDRLDRFFKLQEKNFPYTPTKFFFNYLRIPLIHERIEHIHDIFFKEFTNYVLKLMVKDEIIETLRCLTEIFYRVKHYRNLLSYKEHFQELKIKGVLKTELSLRKFIENMDWIKSSFISPSYQLNYNSINVCLIVIFFRFNPIINKHKILKIIESFPFFTTPKISRNSFSFDLSGYILIPKVYFNNFIEFVIKLKNHGYLIKHNCLLFNDTAHLVNLNYFRQYSQNHRIININNRKYDKRYELEFYISYGEKFYDTKLSLLDFLLIDRIRSYSVSGLGFERRTETLQTLKSDLLNYLITQRSIIKNLKTSLSYFYSSKELKNELINYIELNKNSGFFSIRERLENFLTILNLINKKLIDHPEIKTFPKFQKCIQRENFSSIIEENILLKDNTIKKLIYREIKPSFFNSVININDIIEKYRNFYEFFNSFYNLKIFNMVTIKKILENETLISTIFKKKDEKYKKEYKKYKVHKITNQEIDEILDNLINHQPSIIYPNLINTIMCNLYEKDFFELILIGSQKNNNKLQNLKKFFPRVIINFAYDIFSNEKVYYVEISTPNLTLIEKELLYSIFYNNFKEDIIYGKSYLWHGQILALSNKSFYDFDQRKFFYSKDLYEQTFRYIQTKLGENSEVLQEINYIAQDKFWSKEKNILNLVDKTKFRKKIEFNIKELNKLFRFHFDLNDYLLENIRFEIIKKENYFNKYINSINFIPSFQQFGLGQYFLYFYPTNLNEIDLKLLLINSFQKIKYSACLDKSNSLLIQYIMPFLNPNLSYFNWLRKSKKIIREYCSFFIKKVYHIFHINYNFSPEGWIYNADQFKIYMQNILFNPNYEIQIPNIKKYNVGEKIGDIFVPKSPEFNSLFQIYSWKSVDIKSYIGTKKLSYVKNIKALLEKRLIFPYISLKNIGLDDKIYILLPNLEKELNEKIIKIFCYFNLGFIYEIEGEFFIYGFDKEIKFENGLFIKLYFPKCELSEFFKVFDLLFEYLEIEHYLILYDLVDGKNLLESIYGDLDFLKTYNPLKNLKWNEKDKIWMNHKLFNEKFEPIYPDLFYGKDKYNTE